MHHNIIRCLDKRKSSHTAGFFLFSQAELVLVFRFIIFFNSHCFSKNVMVYSVLQHDLEAKAFVSSLNLALPD